MKLTVKDVDIATGGVHVVILNQKDAAKLDLHHSDRLTITHGKKSTTAVLDIAESEKAVPLGKIGCMEEVLRELKTKGGDSVEIMLERKPDSVEFIKKKLDGIELHKNEILQIVKDIVANKLTEIELTTYVAANYSKGMSMHETVYLTQSMCQTGDALKLPYKKVIDFHCIGGVPGNRTTLIAVPILVAAGLKVPKTSSRAITSPAGTADTMEVLCPVTLPIKKLKKIMDTVGGFIIWGGAINLAPADDKIIAVEHPLSIDAEGQMLASIMAKKSSVSATHLLIDLPVGTGSKILERKKAHYLAKRFEILGNHLGIKVSSIITDGSQPVGNGIGPALEARDCIWVLRNDARGPSDLKERSLVLAGKILELAGKDDGYLMAKDILESGKAFNTMKKIVKAQGGKIPSRMPIGKLSFDVLAGKSGTMKSINNLSISKIARLAGAPLNHGSGLYLHKHAGEKIIRGEPIITIYANNELQISYAREAAKELDVVIR